jgi:hypothetical protein
MQSRQVLALGQKGVKKSIGHYGEQLVCVRHLSDEQRRKRFTPVEISVEDSGWSPPEKPAMLMIRITSIEPGQRQRVF